MLFAAKNPSRERSALSTSSARDLPSAQTTKERKPWLDLCAAEAAQPPHIQAVLFATISGCTISGRQHVRFRAAEEAAPIATDGSDVCYENGPRFEAERASMTVQRLETKLVVIAAGTEKQ